MSEQKYNVLYDEFYYAAPLQGGLQITSMSASLQESLRVPLREFMCNVDFNGDEKEERLVYCPALRRFCKIFISRDVQRVRNFFYHAVSINEAAFRQSLPKGADAFVNAGVALLAATSTAESTAMPKTLPACTKSLYTVPADALCGLVGNTPSVLAKILYFAFMPFFSGGRAVRFGFPSDEKAAFPISGDAATAAVLILSVLPEAFHSSVSMRFSADAKTFESSFKCRYCFFSGSTNVDFHFAAPQPLTAQEDPLGIFAALGQYIAARGLDAYRRELLPVIQAWALACIAKKQVSAELLYVMLRSRPSLQLAAAQLNTQMLEQYLVSMDAVWFDRCADALTACFSTKKSAVAARKALEKNPLFNRTADQLAENGKDAFFCLYAALCKAEAYSDKVNLFSVLYDRFAGSKKGLALLERIKQEMCLTFEPPAKPTPANLFEGMYSLERLNPEYAEKAVAIAVDGYIKTKNEEWIACINSLYVAPQTSLAAENGLGARCEEVFAAAEGRVTLAWLSVICRNRLTADPTLCSRVLGILQNKKISYDELLFCLKKMGLSEAALPALPTFEPLPESCNSLSALSDVKIPMSAAEAEKVRLSMIDRLCALLEKDCSWQDFYTCIPEILHKAKYRPTTKLHPRLEMLMCRQLVVLATDVLSLSDGQLAYVELLTGLRRDYCLCLYPTTGAAAGVFDEKKQFVSSVKKLMLRTLPLLPLCLAVAVTVLVLYVFLPLLPADSNLQTVLPAVFCGISAVMILVQALLLRRHKTADYILPASAATLILALLQLLM